MLDYLHTQNPPIIFRDLKPGNVMKATDGHLKLIDFGLAKTLDVATGGGTRTVVRGAGTPGYAAPEQHRCGTNAATDVYALGATLYSLLTVTVPPDSLALASGQAKLPSLRGLRPDVSAPTAQMIESMMALRRTRLIDKQGSTQCLTADEVRLCEHNQAPNAGVAHVYDLGKSIRDSVVGSGQQMETLHDQPCNKNSAPGKVILDGYQGFSGETDFNPDTKAVESVNLTQTRTNGSAQWIMAPAQDGGQSVGTVYQVHSKHPYVHVGPDDSTQELVVGADGGWRISSLDLTHGTYMISP